MAGRPAKPIGLHLAEGNKRHLSKEEITERHAAESRTKSGNQKLTPSEDVKRNPTAAAMFKKLKGLYKDIEYVEALDSNVINRYCLLHAEVFMHEGTLLQIEKDLEDCAHMGDRIALYKSLAAITRSVQSLRTMMLQIEDRIFLNPTARIKNVPRKQEKEVKDDNAELFR